MTLYSSLIVGLLVLVSAEAFISSPARLTSHSLQQNARLSMHFEEALAEKTLQEGSLTRERYIACNRFKCRPKAAAKFEKRWVDRTSRLAELDGFKWFALLRRVEEYGADYSAEGEFGNYMSLTVWDDKDSFNSWRTGEAFKEAHGGGGITDFVKLLGTALFILDGAPKPAFFDGLLPLASDAPSKIASKAVDGWRKDIVADGENLVEPEVFVAMNRFSIPEEARIPFEQRWAKRESELKDLPGFRFFNMLRRDATEADDGYNYISMSVWEDRGSFEGWRASQQFNKAHGSEKPSGEEASKPKAPPMFKTPPKTAFYEGKVVLESAGGP
eukprot:CAMPEP_0113943270 /NCGR_PEP_ID=MMETSP1339-20121228/22520_1 /TAXON_ID=94617 /ORGANISM="Fibrocapsa japonica" /LENGTH=328 /DNA_ID=CAMNT_0000948099 /DNA_START=52 /DNA_END=1038 /DNA_ORIENTATION=+ /assembly_acc=CAM_ASM_000762